MGLFDNDDDVIDDLFMMEMLDEEEKNDRKKKGKDKDPNKDKDKDKKKGLFGIF